MNKLFEFIWKFDFFMSNFAEAIINALCKALQSRHYKPRTNPGTGLPMSGSAFDIFGNPYGFGPNHK